MSKESNETAKCTIIKYIIDRYNFSDAQKIHFSMAIATSDTSGLPEVQETKKVEEKNPEEIG